MQLSTALSRYRWVILAVVWLSYLTVFLARLSIGPLAPFLKEAFSLSNAEVGSLVSATAITHVPTLIVAGWLVDRIGLRRVLVVGTLIIALCVLALFFAPSYRFMLVILALSGLGTGCIGPSGVKAVTLWFSPKERATAIGLNQTAVNVSGIVGASLLPTVALTLGWRYSFLFVSLGALVACLLAAILFRGLPQETQPVTVRDTIDKSAIKCATNRSKFELFRSPEIWWLGLSGLFLAIIEFSTMAHLVLYLKESLLFSAVAAGGLLALTEAAGAFGKPVSGLISDRLAGGRRKVVLLIICGTSVIVCLVLGAFGQGLGWLLYPVLIILGLVVIGWGSISLTLAAELGGKEAAGLAAGTVSAVWVFGVITGPPLFGYIVDSTGSFETAWFFMALSGAISVGLASLIRERKRKI